MYAIQRIRTEKPKHPRLLPPSTVCNVGGNVREDEARHWFFSINPNMYHQLAICQAVISSSDSLHIQINFD